jgi:hypothetical protein
MAAWRRRASTAFPELRRELSGPGYSMYSLAAALLERVRAAHDAGDAVALRAIYGFAQWCARQRATELSNPIYVSFYEHLMDWRRHRSAVVAWLAPDVVEKARLLWEQRLSGAELAEVRRLIASPRPTAGAEPWRTLEEARA